MFRGWDLAGLARRRPVVRNVATLALSAGAARLLDAGYRLAVARLVGPETLGLLQMAWPVYGFAFTLATLGLGPAIARLVAAEPRQGRGFLASGRALALPAGLASAALLFLAAPLLARQVLPDPRVLAPLRVMALGLVPAALSSVLRGWFQGTQRTAPLASAQLIEPLVRLGAALSVLLYWPSLWSVPLPLPPAALLAVAGTAGEIVEWLCLTGWERRQNRSLPPPRRNHARRPPSPGKPLTPLAVRLLGLGGPLMAGQIVFSALAILKAGLFPRLLVLSGLAPSAATREYGTLYGMVLPFLLFPMTVLFPLSAVLVPAVAEARAAGKTTLLRRRVNLSVRAALIVALCAGAIYLTCPERLAALAGGAPVVAPLIRGLALWAPFAYLEHVSGAALIGLGATGGYVWDGLLGEAVALGLARWLIPLPALRIRGLLAALAAADAVVTAAHFVRLAQAQRPRRPRFWHTE